LHTFLKIYKIMMMKKTALCLMAVVTVTFGANAQTKSVAKKPIAKPTVSKTVIAAPLMKTGLDSFSYAVGVNIGTSMKEQGITSLNGSLMQKAIDDVLKSRQTALTMDQCNNTLQQKLQEFSQKKSSAQKAKGEAFLAANKTKPGVISLANGLQYEVLKAGESNGIKPTAADTVVVHYTGTLIDGTKFDASVDRGEPATFPVGGVIRGWTEILQLMTKGAKWKVAIPSDLAYGDRGAGGAIAPGAALIFEIELLDIKPAVAITK
jgi:FKBP-type peptidyl-prolyl cis-trans isomerase FklB